MNNKLIFKKITYVFKSVTDKIAIIFWVISIITSVLIGLTEIVNAGLLQVIITNLGVNTGTIPRPFKYLSSLTLNQALIFLLAIGLLRLILQMVNGQSLAFFSERLCIYFKSVAVNDLIFKLTNYHATPSEIFHSFSEIVPRFIGTVSIFFNILSSLIQIFIIFFSLIMLLPKESLVAFGGIIIIGFIHSKLSTNLKILSRDINEKSKELTFQVQRSLKNINYFEIMKTQNYESSLLKKIIIDLSGSVLRLNFFALYSTSLTPLLGIALIVVIIILSKSFFLSSGVILISFLYLLFRLIQNINGLSGHINNYHSYSSHFLSGIDYLNSFTKAQFQSAQYSKLSLSLTGKLHETPETNPKNKTQNNLTVAPKILVQNLTFAHSKVNIIQNLDFEINAGEIAAIIGPSGSGKSTLLGLILGVLTPEKGQVLINEIPAKTFFKNSNFNIGYVGAEPYLIKGTILENLLYGIHHEVTEAELADAIEMAQLKDFIDSVGLNHAVNEDYSGISAGQRQRICLARALINKPSLLILDEATANLDEQTEKSIKESIDSLIGKCTIIVVSHKKEFIRGITNVIKL